ncbi:acetyl-CoA carboxylase biotin carboxyl carrier protein subunit, partial [Escherichia coli]|nr:acetyl-CoA carboxylase biotin carboxyl carrier protein subunit [Escherichia coli]
DGSVELRAMMPGKVVRILNAEGSQVSKGDGILVVEAMKMQNEIKSPRDGKVAKIAASEGATVAAGELLAVIE